MGKILLVVLLLAALVYLTIRVIERRGIASPRSPQQRPLGPDDDPDFLRGLDRRPDSPDRPDDDR